VLVAIMGLPLLTRLVPMSLPIGDPAVLDFRVLVFAGVLTGLTGLGFGVVPALRISSRARAESLLEIRNAGVGGRNQRFRSVLVIVEVALSLVLLISSGLLIRALWQGQDIDPGFRGEGVLTVRTELPMPKYYSTARRAQLYTQVLSEVRSLPGVSSAAYVSFLPMVMRGGIWPVGVDGLDVAGQPDRAILRYTTPDFFETLSIPLTAGRDLSEFDTDDVASVAVVSQSFARRYWPGEDPLGLSFNFAFRDRVVAGVVGDIHLRGLEARSEPQVYLPYRQVPDGSIIFLCTERPGRPVFARPRFVDPRHPPYCTRCRPRTAGVGYTSPCRHRRFGNRTPPDPDHRARRVCRSVHAAGGYRYP